VAIDKTLKLEIRAVYESSTLSVAKVLDRFGGCDISAKTVESWVLKEKWIKNKFENEKIAIEKLIDETLPLEDAKEVIKATLVNNDKNTLPPEQLNEYSHLVGKELAFKVLHQNTLQTMLAENILRSEGFAKVAKNIGTVATHHNMLTTTIKTLYGEIKHITTHNSNTKAYTDEELEAMSDEELENLLER
jgi:hypothetical protein